MNLLLDAHALLWFLNDDPQLVPNAKSLIENPTNRRLVSIATCWEIVIKVGLKKLGDRRHRAEAVDQLPHSPCLVRPWRGGGMSNCPPDAAPRSRSTGLTTEVAY